VTADSEETLTYQPSSVSGVVTCSVNYRVADGEGGTASVVASITVEKLSRACAWRWMDCRRILLRVR